MGEHHRQRHILVAVAAGVAEHNALVAGALFVFAGAVHAAGNVAALLVQRQQHRAGIGIELIVALGVANAADGFARNALYVHIGRAGGFAANQRQAGAHKSLARHVTVTVAAQEFVQNCIGNLIRNFVGVPFAYGLGCK